MRETSIAFDGEAGTAGGFAPRFDSAPGVMGGAGARGGGGGGGGGTGAFAAAWGGGRAGVPDLQVRRWGSTVP